MGDWYCAKKPRPINRQEIHCMPSHDPSNCPDIGHIKDKIDSMAEQIERLAALMERQIRLEEQAASHAAAVGRAFTQLGNLDQRVGALEKTETYVRGGVKFAGFVAILTIGILGWALKVQMDIVQQLPVRLDRIERQQTEEIKIDDRLAAEIERLKDASHAAR